MSNRPLKHSEKKKQRQKGTSAASRMKGSWGSPRPSAPTIPVRPERYLIVSEGTETEPGYFGAIKRLVNARYHGEYISVIVRGAGMNTLSLFEEAKRIAEDDPEGFTQVWVVYDKDDFPAVDFNAVADRCFSSSTELTSYHAAWSNESFELWYLLHFEYQQAALRRDDYVELLSTRLTAMGKGRYLKNRSDMYEVLEPLLSTAVANAKRLARSNSGKSPVSSNPGTTVHELVEELLPYAYSTEKRKELKLL